MFNPLVLLLLLLLGLASLVVVALTRPSLSRVTAAVTIGLALLWLLAARSQLPLLDTVETWPAGFLFPPTSWYIDNITWQLSAAVLLLVLVSILYPARGQDAGAAPLSYLLILLLALATVAAILTNSLAGLLSAGTLFTIVWGLLLARHIKSRAVWWRSGALWLSLLFVWMSMSAMPQVAPVPGWKLQGWPTLARSLLLLASVLLIGPYPLHWWRPQVTLLPPGSAALLVTLPVALGASLLARLGTGGDPGLGFALPLTLLGFVSLLYGIISAWQQRDSLQRAAASLVISQAGILLLAGVWAGPEAVLAEARVLLLAGGALLLASRLPVTSLPARAGLILAALAFSAFPLTAGFSGRSQLYDAWLADGRWLLVLAAALLHLPLATAAVVVASGRPANRDFSLNRPDFLAVLPLAPALLGLFSFAGLAGITPLSWIALVLPAAAGVALAYFPNVVREAESLFQEALSLQRPLPRPSPSWWQSISRPAGQALRQAGDLLEGEGGLLWLLLFLIIVWLAQ